MKNVSSFLAFLLVSNFVFGQIEWVGNWYFSEAATDIVHTSKNQYILVHNSLTVLDSVGNVILGGHSNIYPTETIVEYSNVVEMSDSSIMFSFNSHDCEINSGGVMKIYKSWSDGWISFTTTGGGDAARFSDDSFIFAAGGTIEKWDGDMNQLWYLNLAGYETTDLVVTTSDTIILASQQGLLKIDADGVVIDTLSALIFDRLELLFDGNFLAQRNDSLYLYSPNFIQLAFFYLQGENIEDIAVSQDEIAILTSAMKIVRFDISLTDIGTIQLTGQNQTFHAILLTDNGFLVGGGEKYGSDEHGNESAFIKGFYIDGATASTGKDAALTEVSMDSQVRVKNNSDSYYSILMSGISLKVENAGLSIINSLNVNLKIPEMELPIWECPTSQSFSKSFENLNLHPNTSTVLHWGEQELLFAEDPAGQLLDLCFWTSLPNHHLETNNDNDVACTEILVSEHEPFPLSFRQYFNPVADVLFLELQSGFSPNDSEVLVFNAAGRLVYKTTISQQQQTLEMQNLSDGTYFLQVVSGERVGWGKFVKY